MVYLEPEVEVSCLSVNDSDDVSMAENNKLSSDDAKTDSDMHNDGAVLDSALDDANTNQRGSMYIFHILYNLSLCALIILPIVVSASMYSIVFFSFFVRYGYPSLVYSLYILLYGKNVELFLQLYNVLLEMF